MIYIENESINELYKEIARKMLYLGHEVSPRGKKTIEVNDLYATLLNPRDNIITLESRNLNREYLKAEMIWYNSGEFNIDYISQYSSFWKKIADKEGRVNSNYGGILYYDKTPSNCSQFEWIVDRFKEDRTTRQAVINYNQVKHKYSGNKDFPCTLNQQFRITKRDGIEYLDSTTWMRSNDFVYGFPYDVHFFTEVQIRLAETLKCEVGRYNHYVSSMHCYLNFKDHKKILNDVAYE